MWVRSYIDVTRLWYNDDFHSDGLTRRLAPFDDDLPLIILLFFFFFLTSRQYYITSRDVGSCSFILPWVLCICMYYCCTKTTTNILYIKYFQSLPSLVIIVYTQGIKSLVTSPSYSSTVFGLKTDDFFSIVAFDALSMQRLTCCEGLVSLNYCDDRFFVLFLQIKTNTQCQLV